MNILLTNDDGVFSPGLAAAAEVAKDFGSVHIFAPSSQKTGAGRGLIGKRDQAFEAVTLDIGGDTVEAFHIDCTPALVLKHAFHTILKDKKIDLLLSGVNYGENIGYDITVSGTVGAAIEGAVRGIPSFAVSLQTPIDNHLTYEEVDWRGVKHFLSLFIEKFLEKGGFQGFDVLKIDIPQSATERTEWELCRLSRQSYFKTVLEDPGPDTKLSKVKLIVDQTPHEEGTDAYTLLNRKKVAVTPLTLDFSAYGCEDYFS